MHGSTASSTGSTRLDFTSSARAGRSRSLDACVDATRNADTFGHSRFGRKPANNVYQNDFVFATETLKPARCEVLDDEASWRYSDHLPVLATFTAT